MQQIRIVGRDANGNAFEYLHFSVPIMAELAFYAITHDPVARGEVGDDPDKFIANWYLEVKQYIDSEGHMHNHPGIGHQTSEWICVNWHCPPNGNGHEYMRTVAQVDGFNTINQPTPSNPKG